MCYSIPISQLGVHGTRSVFSLSSAVFYLLRCQGSGTDRSLRTVSHTNSFNLRLNKLKNICPALLRFAVNILLEPSAQFRSGNGGGSYRWRSEGGNIIPKLLLLLLLLLILDYYYIIPNIILYYNVIPNIILNIISYYYPY